jgi:hypothetical protein
VPSLLVDAGDRVNFQMTPDLAKHGLRVNSAEVYVYENGDYVVDPLAQVEISGTGVQYKYSKGRVPSGLDYVVVKYAVPNGRDVTMRAFIPTDATSVKLGVANTKTVDWFLSLTDTQPTVDEWTRVKNYFDVALSRACYDPSLPYSTIYKRMRAVENGIFDSAELTSLVQEFAVSSANLRMKFGENRKPYLSRAIPIPSETQLNLVNVRESNSRYLYSETIDLDGDEVLVRWKMTGGETLPTSWIKYKESAFLPKAFWPIEYLKVDSTFDDSTETDFRAFGLNLSVCDGGRLQSYDYHVTIDDVNRAPYLTSTRPSNVSISEFVVTDPVNTTKVYTVKAKDADGDAISMSLDVSSSPNVFLSATPTLTVQGMLIGRWVGGDVSTDVVTAQEKKWPLTASTIRMPEEVTFKSNGKVMLKDYPAPGQDTELEYEGFTPKQGDLLGVKLKSLPIASPVNIGSIDLLCTIKLGGGARSFDFVCSHTHESLSTADFEWRRSYRCPTFTATSATENENCFYRRANAPDGVNPDKDQLLYLIYRPQNNDSKRGDITAYVNISDYPRAGATSTSIEYKVTDVNSTPLVTGVRDISQHYPADPVEILNYSETNANSNYKFDQPWVRLNQRIFTEWDVGSQKYTDVPSNKRTWVEKMLWRKVSAGPQSDLFAQADYFYFVSEKTDAHFSKIIFGNNQAFPDNHKMPTTPKFDGDTEHRKARLLRYDGTNTYVYIPHFYGPAHASIQPSDTADVKDLKQDAVCRISNWFYRNPASYQGLVDKAIDINDAGKFKADPIHSDVKVVCAQSYGSTCSRTGACAQTDLDAIAGLSQAGLDTNGTQFDMAIERLLFGRVPSGESGDTGGAIDGTPNFYSGRTKVLATAADASTNFLSLNSETYNSVIYGLMYGYFTLPSKWDTGQKPDHIDGSAKRLLVQKIRENWGPSSTGIFPAASNTGFGEVLIDQRARTITFGATAEEFRIGKNRIGGGANTYLQAGQFVYKQYQYIHPNLACRYLVRDRGNRVILTCTTKTGSDTAPKDYLTELSGAAVIDVPITYPQSTKGIAFDSLPAGVSFVQESPGRFKLNGSDQHLMGVARMPLVLRGNFYDPDVNGRSGASQDTITMNATALNGALIDAAVVYRKKDGDPITVTYNNACLNNGKRGDNSVSFTPKDVYNLSFMEIGASDMATGDFIVVVYPDSRCSTRDMMPTGIDNTPPWIELKITDGTPNVDTRLKFSFDFFDKPYPPYIYGHWENPANCAGSAYSFSEYKYLGQVVARYEYGTWDESLVAPEGCESYSYDYSGTTNMYVNGVVRSVSYVSKSRGIYCYDYTGSSGSWMLPVYRDSSGRAVDVRHLGNPANPAVNYIWNESPAFLGQFSRPRADETTNPNYEVGLNPKACRFIVIDDNYDDVKLGFLKKTSKNDFLIPVDQSDDNGEFNPAATDYTEVRRKHGINVRADYGLGPSDGSTATDLDFSPILGVDGNFVPANAPKPLKIANLFSKWYKLAGLNAAGSSLATGLSTFASSGLTLRADLGDFKVINFRQPRFQGIDTRAYLMFSKENLKDHEYVCEQDLMTPAQDAAEPMGGVIYQALRAGSLHTLKLKTNFVADNFYNADCVNDSGEVQLTRPGCVYQFTAACAVDPTLDQEQARDPSCYAPIASATKTIANAKCFSVDPKVEAKWSQDGVLSGDAFTEFAESPYDLYFEVKGVGDFVEGTSGDARDWRCAARSWYKDGYLDFRCSVKGDDQNKYFAVSELKSQEKDTFNTWLSSSGLNVKNTPTGYTYESPWEKHYEITWAPSLANPGGADPVAAPAIWSGMLVAEDAPVPIFGNKRARVTTALHMKAIDVLSTDTTMAMQTTWLNVNVGEGDSGKALIPYWVQSNDAKVAPFVTSAPDSESSPPTTTFIKNLSAWFQRPHANTDKAGFQNWMLNAAESSKVDVTPNPENSFVGISGFEGYGSRVTPPLGGMDGFIKVAKYRSQLEGLRFKREYKSDHLPYTQRFNLKAGAQWPMEFYTDNASEYYPDYTGNGNTYTRSTLGRGGKGAATLTYSEAYPIAAGQPKITVYERNDTPCLTLEGGVAATVRGTTCDPDVNNRFAAATPNNMSAGSTVLSAANDASGVMTYEIEVKGFDDSGSTPGTGTTGSNGKGIAEGVPYGLRLAARDPNFTGGSVLNARLLSSPAVDRRFPFDGGTSITKVLEGGASAVQNLPHYWAIWSITGVLQDPHVRKTTVLDAGLELPKIQVEVYDNGQYPGAARERMNFSVHGWDYNSKPNYLGPVAFWITGQDMDMFINGFVPKFKYDLENQGIENNIVMAAYDMDRGDTLQFTVTGQNAYGFAPGDFSATTISPSHPNYDLWCKNPAKISKNIETAGGQELACVKISFKMKFNTVADVNFGVTVEDVPWWAQPGVTQVYNPSAGAYVTANYADLYEARFGPADLGIAPQSVSGSVSISGNMAPKVLTYQGVESYPFGIAYNDEGYRQDFVITGSDLSGVSCQLTKSPKLSPYALEELASLGYSLQPEETMTISTINVANDTKICRLSWRAIARPAGYNPWVRSNAAEMNVEVKIYSGATVIHTAAYKISEKGPGANTQDSVRSPQYFSYSSRPTVAVGTLEIGASVDSVALTKNASLELVGDEAKEWTFSAPFRSHTSSFTYYPIDAIWYFDGKPVAIGGETYKRFFNPKESGQHTIALAIHDGSMNRYTYHEQKILVRNNVPFLDPSEGVSVVDAGFRPNIDTFLFSSLWSMPTEKSFVVNGIKNNATNLLTYRNQSSSLKTQFTYVVALQHGGLYYDSSRALWLYSNVATAGPSLNESASTAGYHPNYGGAKNHQQYYLLENGQMTATNQTTFGSSLRSSVVFSNTRERAKGLMRSENIDSSAYIVWTNDLRSGRNANRLWVHDSTNQRTLGYINVGPDSMSGPSRIQDFRVATVGSQKTIAVATVDGIYMVPYGGTGGGDGVWWKRDENFDLAALSSDIPSDVDRNVTLSGNARIVAFTGTKLILWNGTSVEEYNVSYSLGSYTVTLARTVSGVLPLRSSNPNDDYSSYNSVTNMVILIEGGSGGVEMVDMAKVTPATHRADVTSGALQSVVCGLECYVFDAQRNAVIPLK